MRDSDSFYIGWDVGGWNCDNNGRSRDAVVILNSKLEIFGIPWRGNLRTTINEAKNTHDWLQRLFTLCRAELPAEAGRVFLAIDTPLGFSEAFTRLVTRLEEDGQIGQSNTNPYLFRQTEQFLFDHGLTPLSAIKDMIGSQATKGMHVLAKFVPRVTQCGVWTDGELLTAIEAYPSACKGSPLIQESLKRYVAAESIKPPGRLWTEGVDHPDKVDALTCAIIAHFFASQSDELARPTHSIPMTEGWIWVPKDVLQPDFHRRIIFD